ncbi:phospholipase-like protein [Tanacetum coccineum]
MLIDGRTPLEFGKEDFCLITGFRFDKVEIDPKEEDHSEFRQRVLPGVPNLKGEHLLKLINKDVKFNKLDDEDVVRVCLLLALDYVFMGRELRHRVYNVAIDRKKFHLDKLASNPKYDANYVLYGFVFPLKIGNQSENVPVCGLDQQFMEGVSQCMNVDEPYKNFNDVLYNFPINGLDHRPMEGVSECTILNDEYESVAIDGLISLRSQDVGHISKKSFVKDDPEFKVKENEEASHSDSFLSTQQVRELMNDVFYTPSLGLNSVKDDACVSELMDVDQPSLVNMILLVPQLHPKRIVSVPEVIMALFRDKNRMEMRGTFPWVDDGHLVQIDFWEKLVGRSHTKRGWLSSDDPNADWEIASPYLSVMLSRFEYPLYYADGVKYDVPWFANTVQKVYFPINEKDSHWVFGELHIISGLITIYDSLGGPPNGIETRYFLLQLREKLMFQILLYLDNAEVFEKKNIDKLKYSITFRYADGVPLQGGLYGDCGIWVCVFLYRLSHNIPLEVDDPISFALAYRIRMIEFYWKYKMLQ